MGTIRQITTLLLFLVSAIAVLMVIVGGFKYVVSQGDQAAITSAKNTILYSLIGLVVAIASFAIIEFIFNALNVK